MAQAVTKNTKIPVATGQNQSCHSRDDVDDVEKTFSPHRTRRSTGGLVQPELARVVAIFTLHRSRAPHALFATSKSPYRPRGR